MSLSLFFLSFATLCLARSVIIATLCLPSPWYLQPTTCKTPCESLASSLFYLVVHSPIVPLCPSLARLLLSLSRCLTVMSLFPGPFSPPQDILQMRSLMPLSRSSISSSRISACINAHPQPPAGAISSLVPREWEREGPAAGASKPRRA